MTKKSVIISTLILLFAFLLIGIINSLMGRPSLFTDKLKAKDKSQSTTQTNSNVKNTVEDYSYVTLENVLKVGSSGDEVKKVQYILKQKGFYSGEITGNFDDNLEKAVLNFQKNCKIEETGIVNMDTIAALTNNSNQTSQNPSDSSQTSEDNTNSDNSKDEYQNVQFTRDIYPGMTGEDVKKAQYLLKDKGYYKGEITGNYDDSTKKAVIAFQMDNNITQTGNVGKMTRAALTK
jgi:peptidoglycan hydrolase-like protein with peptidoglycan-binding domain